MLSFGVSFTLDKLKLPKNARIRVVGEYEENQLIFAINTQINTTLYLVSWDGNTVVIYSLRGYADIVSASFSPDQELLFYVERFTKGTKFRFKGSLVNIHSFATAKIFESVNPITGIFFPSEYHNSLLYICGTAVTLYSIEFSKRKISLKEQKTQINQKEVSRWFFSYQNRYFATINRSSTAQFCNFKNDKFDISTYRYEENIKAILPFSLSLMPNTPSNLPYYSFSRGNQHIIILKSDIGYIEQIYIDEDSPLTFAVGLVTHGYYQEYKIHHVAPDLPISFLQDEKIVLVFIPNQFGVIVDFVSIPPNVYSMPKHLMISPTSDLFTSINGSQNFVDLSTRVVYNVTFSIRADTLSGYTSELLRIVAVLSARIPNSVHIPSIIEKLSEEPIQIQLFFQYYFEAALAKCSPAHEQNPSKAKKVRKLIKIKREKIPTETADSIAEIEKDFPSAGRVSRKDKFKAMVDSMVHASSKDLPAILGDALHAMHTDNEVAISLRAALDGWLRLFRPPPHRVLAVGVALMGEMAVVSAPCVPCLGDELAAACAESAPPVLQRQLRLHGLFAQAAPAHSHPDMAYWGRRLPEQFITQNSSRISSLCFSNTRSSAFVSDDSSADSGCNCSSQ